MLNPQESALLRGWAQGFDASFLSLQYNEARSVAQTRRLIEHLRVKLVDHARKHEQSAWAEKLGGRATK